MFDFYVPMLDWRRVKHLIPKKSRWHGTHEYAEIKIKLLFWETGYHHQVSEYYPGAFPYSFDFLYWEEVPSQWFPS